MEQGSLEPSLDPEYRDGKFGVVTQVPSVSRMHDPLPMLKAVGVGAVGVGAVGVGAVGAVGVGAVGVGAVGQMPQDRSQYPAYGQLGQNCVAQWSGLVDAARSAHDTVIISGQFSTTAA